MSPSIVLLAVFIYITILFGLARLGDKQHFVKTSWVRHPAIYALALGVYCTSWTFYGLVGTASERGWNFFPILLGPILLFTLGFPLLQRIYKVCRQEHIHSIADFIASRYGKRQGVAATVTVVVLLATIPYIALQLKAVSDTLLLTVGENFLVSQDLTFVIGLCMIAFALLFGAKRLDMSGYHAGLMSAIAFESVVKVMVLILVAIFSLVVLSNTNMQSVNEPVISVTDAAPPIFYQPISWLRFLVETLLSICAIFCLPRMFHVTFVECLSETHLKNSRWLFVIYLAMITACIVIIAIVGNTLFFDTPTVKGDTYVISLPLQQNVSWLALLAFLGGFSAATAMVIVATITLSQMLSNDVFLPLLMRRKKNTNLPHDFSRSLIICRRLTVILVVVGAYLYQSILAENAALTSIGLNAFALVVQLAPAILFGLYWRKGNARGLYAGLVVGVLLWFYTLMIPLLVDAGLLNDTIVNNGLFNIAWLRPECLFGLTFGDSFTRGVILSLSTNILFYCWYSITSNENLVDRIQASAFTQLKKGAYDQYEDINVDDLRALLTEFVGDASSNAIFSEYYAKKDKASNISVKPLSKHDLVEKSQKILAGVVGVASSQSMIQSLSSGKKMAVEEVVNLFGETAKALRFNQEILSASFENISSGISVVDEDLRLVAWNNHYENMFNYPENMLHIGFHVSDIMRFNGERGLLGDGNIDELIRKRLSFMASGQPYRVVRYHDNNTVIEIKGRPLPNGGYVTTYDDITEFMTIQRNLEDTNANLERRVQDRTKIIEEVNADLLKEIQQRGHIEEALREAKKNADEANASKTKFLALASHDILQPLNAANLYASALLDSRQQSHQDTTVVKQLKSAIQNSESIITTLLEVSKLDSGAIQPNLSNFKLDDMLMNIIDEIQVQLPEGLEIRYCKTSVFVCSDRNYLHRIVQNFISNAVKYTRQGKVLIGCRRRKNGQGQDCVEICVLDNGPGISDHEKLSIFDDFYRINSASTMHAATESASVGDTTKKQIAENIPGVGLGLSVVARFSELLNHPIACQSKLDKGSYFSVVVPQSLSCDLEHDWSVQQTQQDGLKNLKVVYVDDEPQNLSATSALLHQWQCHIVTIDSIAEAYEYAREGDIPDVLLMDYQLDQPETTGLMLAKDLVEIWRQRGGHSESVSEDGCSIPVCIVSASTESDLPQRVMETGFQFLRKPVKLGRLRALLEQLKDKKDIERSH